MYQLLWYEDSFVLRQAQDGGYLGYDYHSSPDQKRDDDIRARKLKRCGWKEILRYSGIEINRINDNLELTHYNFEEIMDIILL